jgi:hypothetical protein
MLKKAANGVLAILPCSRTEGTLRSSKGLRPCWTDFFEHSRLPLISIPFDVPYLRNIQQVPILNQSASK